LSAFMYHPTLMSRFDLICFDVDGTLVEHPSGRVIWEVLNLKFIGDDRVNRERYEMYHAGKITYDEWVALDVGGWIEKGATREEIISAVGEFELIEGALETLHELKSRGYRLAVISGTLDVVIENLFPDHPFDDVFTNKIFFDEEGRLASWQATPFDLHGKPVALEELARKHSIALERTAFVGDGDNDVPLLGVVGYLVAFNARSPELEAGADLVIKEKNLRLLLDIFE